MITLPPDHNRSVFNCDCSSNGGSSNMLPLPFTSHCYIYRNCDRLAPSQKEGRVAMRHPFSPWTMTLLGPNVRLGKDKPIPVEVRF